MSATAPEPRPRRGAASPSGRVAGRVLALALAALVVLVAPGTAAARAPHIAARAAILVEPSSGEVLYARSATSHRPIASTTKLMTALLTLEQLPLGHVCTSPGYGGSPIESQIHLRAGERMRVRDLLRALLLPSANDAAFTLARCVSGSQGGFVAGMNRRARRLGLRSTHYANPIGLDAPGNYSSATDLVKLVLELRRFSFFRHTVNLPSARLGSGAVPRTVVNRNNLIREIPAVDGVKTGHTRDAGYVLVSSADQHGVTVISAVLGDPSEGARDSDSRALLRYGLRTYRLATTVRRGSAFAHPHVRDRGDERVALVAGRGLRIVLRRGLRPSFAVRAPSTVDGPLPPRRRVGTLTVRLRGRVRAHIPLLTRDAIPGPPLASQVAGFIGRPGTLAAIGALVLLALGLARARRRTRGREVPA